MTTETVRVIKSHMSHTVPKTPAEIQEAAGVSRATVYNTLRVLKAERHHIGKNTFGYTLPEVVLDRGTVENPGIIDGVTWAEYVAQVLKYVQKIHLGGNPTPQSYVRGFQQIAGTFQLIADHVRAVEHRPDWRLVLGIDKEK